jgi:hypothetical protein
MQRSEALSSQINQLASIFFGNVFWYLNCFKVLSFSTLRGKFSSSSQQVKRESTIAHSTLGAVQCTLSSPSRNASLDMREIVADKGAPRVEVAGDTRLHPPIHSC